MTRRAPTWDELTPDEQSHFTREGWEDPKGHLYNWLTLGVLRMSSPFVEVGDNDH
jgi:hypothetical protein